MRRIVLWRCFSDFMKFVVFWSIFCSATWNARLFPDHKHPVASYDVSISSEGVSTDCSYSDTFSVYYYKALENFCKKKYARSLSEHAYFLFGIYSSSSEADTSASSAPSCSKARMLREIFLFSSSMAMILASTV